MDDSDLRCLCGKPFSQPGALANHRRACSSSKACIKNALARAKTMHKSRKRKQDAQESLGNDGLDRDLVHDDSSSEVPPAKIPRTNTPANTGATNESLNSQDRLQASEAVSNPHPQDNLSTPNLTIPSNSDGPTQTERRTRSGRLVTTPARYCDDPPETLAPIPRTRCTDRSDNNAQRTLTTSVPADPPDAPPFRTPRNRFGMFAQYDAKPNPSHLPNEQITSDDLADIQTPQPTPLPTVPQPLPDNDYQPYPNLSSFLIGEWFWTGGQQKSKAELSKLIKILTDANFSLDDICSTSWDDVDDQLGESSKDSSGWMDKFEDAGWIREEIHISVPFHNQMAHPGPKDFNAGHFYRRSIVSVMRERLSRPDSRNLHLEPFQLYWQPDDSTPEQRVYGELYNSPAFLEAHRQLQQSPAEPGCGLQRVVMALMFSSDETHLTQFGETKLWPLYLFFGNDSKYSRSKPSSSLCNHVAYFTTLPETFKDFVRESNGGKGPTASLCSHCQRELLHAQWKLILDDEFMDAFNHGIVIRCCDGIERRFYPRIFTYSADYKEKAILSGIRNLGKHLCPRCLVVKSQVDRMGMVLDQRSRITQARSDNLAYRAKISSARSIIYEQNFAVENSSVKELLKDMSVTPVEIAFSAKLSSQGFNFFSTMVVDFMHDVESGNWRSSFIHILRILNSVNEQLVHDMDWRYRQIPTFGGDTIRKFRRNTSEMKNLAARDWEDMLQCAIPVFDGLLEGEGNSLLLDLLFVYAEWHGLAKLRIHTDATLTLLESATRDLGGYMRKFKAETSKLYATRELRKEVDARIRRKYATGNQKKANDKQVPDEAIPTSQPRPKELNLETYKFHALGDYPETIRRFGTTDSYSTETGELEHRTSKSRYARTNKKDSIQQMTKIDRRQSRIKSIRKKLLVKARPAPKAKAGHLPSLTPEDPIENNFMAQYNVGKGQNQPVSLSMFMQQHSTDPATEGFITKLKQHLLPRVCTALGLTVCHDLRKSPVMILFQSDRIYQHGTIRFNYTTYDVRRAQDVINPTRSGCNVMLLADKTPATELHSSHPFLYARVLGIYHVNVICMPTGSGGNIDWSHKELRMEFLWVRWYQHHPATIPYRLDTLTFPDVYEADAFGFVNPKDVLRACHVIPIYSKGQFAEGSLSELAQDGSDWVEYYIGRFSDRDLLMRYHWGMGIGHRYAYPSNCSESQNSTSCNIGNQQEDNTMDTEQNEPHPNADECDGDDEDDLERQEDEDLGNESERTGDGSESDSD